MGCWNKIGPTQIDCTDSIGGVGRSETPGDGGIPEEEIFIIPPSEIDPEVPIPTVFYTTEALTGRSYYVGWARPNGYYMLDADAPFLHEYFTTPLYREAYITLNSDPRTAQDDVPWPRYITRTAVGIFNPGPTPFKLIVPGIFAKSDRVKNHSTLFTFNSQYNPFSAYDDAAVGEILGNYQIPDLFKASISVASTLRGRLDFTWTGLGRLPDHIGYADPLQKSLPLSLNTGEIIHQYNSNTTSPMADDQTEVPWIHVRKVITPFTAMQEVTDKYPTAFPVVSTTDTDFYTTLWENRIRSSLDTIHGWIGTGINFTPQEARMEGRFLRVD